MLGNTANTEYIGMVYGTYRVKSIDNGHVVNSVIWELECIYCGKIKHAVGLHVLNSYKNNCLERCECCNSGSTIDSDDADVYDITKDDRIRLRKIRYHILKTAVSKGLVVERDWNESSDRFIRWAVDSGYRPYKRLYRKNNLDGFTVNNCYWAVTRGKGGSSVATVEKSDKSTDNEVLDLVNRMRLANGGISVRLYSKLENGIKSVQDGIDDVYKCYSALRLLGGVNGNNVGRVEDLIGKVRNGVSLLGCELGIGD